MNETLQAVPIEPVDTSIDTFRTRLSPMLESLLKPGDVVHWNPRTPNVRTLVIAPAEPMSPFQRVMEEVRMRELDRRDGYYAPSSSESKRDRELARINRQEEAGQAALEHALQESIEQSLSVIRAQRKEVRRENISERRKPINRKRRFGI